MIFISHSSNDDVFVDHLCGDLNRLGYVTWVDHKDIPAGETWDNVVEDALDRCDTMILVLSQSAVDSGEVRVEWSEFKDQRKTIIPLIIEECPIPLRLRLLQRIDLIDKRLYKVAVRKLVRALPPPPPVPPPDPDNLMVTREFDTRTLTQNEYELASIKQEVRLLRSAFRTILREDQMLFVMPKVGQVDVVEMRKDKLFVGWYDIRSPGRPDIDLAPYDPIGHGVSRQHALLSRRRDSVLIEDLGSTNGTFVNGTQIPSMAPVLIENETILRFGALVAQVFFRV